MNVSYFLKPKKIPFSNKRIVCVQMKKNKLRRPKGSRVSGILQVIYRQRVLNDSQMTRLSCGRMIRLLSPPSPRHVSLSLFLSLLVCREGGGRGAKSYDRERALYKSFNTRLFIGIQYFLVLENQKFIVPQGS